MKKIMSFIVLAIVSVASFAFNPANLIGTWQAKSHTSNGDVIVQTFSIQSDYIHGLYHYYRAPYSGPVPPKIAACIINRNRTAVSIVDGFCNYITYGVMIEVSDGVFKWYNSFKEYEQGEEGVPVKKISNSVMDMGFRYSED